MSNPLIMKLECAGALTDEDKAKLEEITSGTRKVDARQDLLREGDRPENVHLIMEGLACRYKMMPNGKRQIMAYLVPGDFCDLHVAILGEMDHGIATLAPSTLVEIPKKTVVDLTANHPLITRALWWATLVDEATLREWLVNMAQRPADSQLAHLICELLVRLQAVGRASANSFELPITQEELGETLGLSTVHVNRTLQGLRAKGLITLKGKKLTIEDMERLQEFAGFNPNYLHLTPRRNGR